MTPENTGIKRNEKGQFPKGVSGNPAGKPLGSISIVSRIKRIFEEEPEYFEAYVRNVLKDDKLRGEVIRQIDGSPKQTIAGVEGEPIVINMVKYGDDKPTVQAT